MRCEVLFRWFKIFMSLILFSGVPCAEKNILLAELLWKLGERPVAVIDHVMPVANGKVALARIKSLVTNMLSDSAALVVNAPLSIKSLRYELYSIARNKKCSFVHLFVDSAEECVRVPPSETGDTGAGEAKDWEKLPIKRVVVREEGLSIEESLRMLRGTFELPRPADKWDYPQLSPSTDALTLRDAISLRGAQRKATTKLVPESTDMNYAQKVKRIVDKVLGEQENVPLKQRRDIEEMFIGSIKAKPISLSGTEEAFRGFLASFMRLS